MRVLVVDDEPNMVRLMQKTLERQGYQVETAGDGAEALAKIQENLPDIVITDTIMPNMDGWDLTDRLRSDARLTAIKVAHLTARPSLAEDNRRFVAAMEEAIAEGNLDGFLMKPFNPRELVQLVDRLASAIPAERTVP